MRRWLKSLPEKVADHIIVPLLALMVVAVAGVLLARLEEDVPAWTALVAVVLVAAGAFALGRRRASTQEVTALIDDLFVQVELHLYYADHIYEVLETLQKVISGSIPDVGFDEFVERGMLEPARGYLTQAPERTSACRCRFPTRSAIPFSCGSRLGTASREAETSACRSRDPSVATRTPRARFSGPATWRQIRGGRSMPRPAPVGATRPWCQFRSSCATK